MSENNRAAAPSCSGPPSEDLDTDKGDEGNTSFDEELFVAQLMQQFSNRRNACHRSRRARVLIGRLLHSQGQELRTALLNLERVLQSNEDLVQEFVAKKGLDYLMQIGNMADHNILDYIVRAFGQILLYKDGIQGVMANNHCVQWLYSLVASKSRYVVKTVLKLLLIFVGHTAKNCLLLIDAITSVDHSDGKQLWSNVMGILRDVDASDTELLIYATTLINKCLNNIPDRNVYYDHVDALQNQGIADVIQLYMSRQGTDLDLLRQLQILEAVLFDEDDDESGTALKQLHETVRNSSPSTPEKKKSKRQQIKEIGRQEVLPTAAGRGADDNMLTDVASPSGTLADEAAATVHKTA